MSTAETTAPAKEWWGSCKVDVPEGESGVCRVERYTVTREESEWGRVRAIASFSSRGRYVREGTYTRLRRYGETIMSDTNDEIRDHYPPILRAKRVDGGLCLINGLGLGMVTQSVLVVNPAVRVRVVEQSPDVIALVAPHYRERFGDRFEVVQADAFDYKPTKGERYVVVWHDIWDNICGDNLPEMARLHRKYARRADWQGSWGRDECRRLVR